MDELEREEFFRLKKIQGKKQRDLEKAEQEKVGSPPDRISAVVAFSGSASPLKQSVFVI